MHRGEHRAASAVRLVSALRSEHLPPPPAEPPLAIVLLGFSAEERDRIARLAAALGVRAGSTGTTHGFDGWLVDGEQSAPEIARIAAARARGDLRPALVAATTRAERASRDAHAARAHFVAGAIAREDLEVLVARVELYRPTSIEHDVRRCREGLADWVLDVLGPCGITERRSQIVALAALGRRRADIALALEIRLDKVDEHIGAILKATGQQRLTDVTGPFRARLAQESGGPKRITPSTAA